MIFIFYDWIIKAGFRCAAKEICMKRVELNKENKRASLLKTSFQLFSEKGFAKTSISDIVKEAGMAKGTFYLYFKDKYDLRDQLVIRKSLQVIREANEALESKPQKGFENQFIAYVDHIIECLEKDKILLRFINRNLSGALFESMMEGAIGADLQNLLRRCEESMAAEHIICSNLHLMVFTLMELLSGTMYSCILDGQPVTMEEYLPYLHESIRAIIHAFCREQAEDTENPAEP